MPFKVLKAQTLCGERHRLLACLASGRERETRREKKKLTEILNYRHQKKSEVIESVNRQQRVESVELLRTSENESASASEREQY